MTVELFRTKRGGKFSGNYKFYDANLRKNVDTGTDDLELARVKYPSAIEQADSARPSFASVMAPQKIGIIGQDDTGEGPKAQSGNPTTTGTTTVPVPASTIPGSAAPASQPVFAPAPVAPPKRVIQYTAKQIEALRTGWVIMIAEADCDTMRLMFSLFGYTTPEIRPEDVASIKLGFEMLAMEWFENGVPPAWMVLLLTHCKLMTRMALNAKPKVAGKPQLVTEGSNV